MALVMTLEGVACNAQELQAAPLQQLRGSGCSFRVLAERPTSRMLYATLPGHKMIHYAGKTISLKKDFDPEYTGKRGAIRRAPKSKRVVGRQLTVTWASRP
jgi:hypothetical protein